MNNRKRIAVLGVMLGMGMAATGCSGPEDAPQAEVREMFMGDEEQTNPGNDEEESTEADTNRSESEENTKEDAETDEEAQNAEQFNQDEINADESEDGRTINASQAAEHLGGKVQSPRADGMILAQTTLVDEEGMVTLLEVEDARKIQVRFTADTKVEHWIIQGGGAGIDMKEAAFSDLEEGQGVELEGYFDGEEFVAAKVIIEVYE